MMKANKWIAIVMVITIMMGFAGALDVRATDKSKTETEDSGSKEDKEASFQIINANPTKKKLKKGDSFGIYVEVRTYGKNIKFDYADFTNTASVDTGTATSKVTLAEQATGGTEIYVGGLTYLGGDGNINFTIYAQEDGGSASANIKIQTEQISDGQGELQLKDASQISLVAGQTKKVDFLIYNRGSSTVKDPLVNVSIAGENSEGISIKKGGAINVPSIAAKSSVRISFEIEVSKVVRAGNYKIQLDLAGTGQTVDLRIINDFVSPQLQFYLEGSPDVKPGKVDQLQIRVENVGDSSAKEVKIELENQEDLSIIGGSNVNYVSKIEAKKSSRLRYNIKIDPKTKKNMLPIKIIYSYKDEIGESVQDKQQYIYLSVKDGLAGDGEVVVTNMIAPSKTLGVDQSFNVKFTLEALKGDGKNVKISVSAEDPAAIVPRSQNLFMIPTFKKGAKRQHVITMSATPKAGSQSHPIKIHVTYDSIKSDEKIEFVQYTSVNIFNPEAEDKEDQDNDQEENKKRQPKVIIGEYNVTPTVVKAGEDFQLSIGFLNTNRLKSVHNLKANLTIKEQGENDAGNVFTPVNASNTFYIADLMPEQMIMKNITMYTIPNAKPKTYQVQLELEYEDEAGNEIKAVESIGIPVEQITRVDISQVEMDIMSLGMPTPLDVSLYNTGKTTINNLMVYTEGEGFSVQDNKMFIGSFEQGSSEYYSPMIIPEQIGMLSGTIVLEYEEATGETTQIRQDFDFEVMDMPDDMGDMGDMPFPEDEEKGKLPLILGIIAGILLAGGITAFILKKRKNKKDLEFDLDE